MERIRWVARVVGLSQNGGTAMLTGDGDGPSPSINISVASPAEPTYLACSARSAAGEHSVVDPLPDGERVCSVGEGKGSKTTSSHLEVVPGGRAGRHCGVGILTTRESGASVRREKPTILSFAVFRYLPLTTRRPCKSQALQWMSNSRH